MLWLSWTSLSWTRLDFAVLDFAVLDLAVLDLIVVDLVVLVWAVFVVRFEEIPRSCRTWTRHATSHARMSPTGIAIDQTGNTRNATTPPTIAVAAISVSRVRRRRRAARRAAERVARGLGGEAAAVVGSRSTLASTLVDDALTAGVGSGVSASSVRVVGRWITRLSGLRSSSDDDVLASS